MFTRSIQSYFGRDEPFYRILLGNRAINTHCGNHSSRDKTGEIAISNEDTRFDLQQLVPRKV